MTNPGWDPTAMTQRRRFRVAVAQAAQAVQQAVATPGPKGDKGDIGPRGLPGADGAAGRTAYELAVQGGYTGTQTQWLASLVGPQGTPGLTYLTTGTAAVGAMVANVANSVTVQLQNPMRDTTYNTRVIGMAAMVGANVTTVVITRTLTSVTISCTATAAVAASSLAVVAWQ